MKPRVAVFSLTSCFGCQVSLLDLEDFLLDIFNRINLVHFPLLMAENEKGPFDITFVEGAVANAEQAAEIRKIRKKSKTLIALGTCASYGGVPSIKDFGVGKEIEEIVYKDTSFLTSISVQGIGHYVNVDYYLRGCPMIKQEFLKLLKALLVGKKPVQEDNPVCVECRKNGTVCLLQEGKPCMGPVSYGGCNALCPSHKIPCYGCRGPLDDGNISSLAKLFEKQGLTKEDIKQRFIMFAGTSKRLNEEIKNANN